MNIQGFKYNKQLFSDKLIKQHSIISSCHFKNSFSTRNTVSSNKHLSMKQLVKIDCSSSSDDSNEDSQSDFESEVSCDEDENINDSPSIVLSNTSVQRHNISNKSNESSIEKNVGNPTLNEPKNKCAATKKTKSNQGCRDKNKNESRIQAAGSNESNRKGNNVLKDLYENRCYFKTNLDKFIIPLESEKDIYITGATLLVIKGVVSYKEYMSNKYQKPIPQEILNKKFYIRDILGALRGLTRRKIASDCNRSPSLTMYENMLKEDEEIIASGGKFISDPNESSDNEEEAEGLTSDNEELITKHKSDSKRNISRPTTSSNVSKMKSLSVTIEKFDSVKNERKTRMASKSDDSSVKKSRKQEKSKKIDEDSDYEDNESMKSGQGSEHPLPEELLNCGTCGMAISSLQHLDRHLERCRGSKRKGKSESNRKRLKQGSSDQVSPTGTAGELYVIDTNDGEIIEGWGPPMGAVPPGPICPRCAFEVPTLFDLPLHQKHHNGGEFLTCPVCPFSTDYIPVYLIHVEDHTSS